MPICADTLSVLKNDAPISDETSVADVPVSGTPPAPLASRCLRIGPNPIDPSAGCDVGTTREDNLVTRPISEPGRLIGEGRDALVYDIGGGRVLRRYRRPQDTTVEARMMTWVNEHGVRVPQVFDVDGSDLVMERIDGRAALAGLATHPWRVGAVGRLLSDLHRRLDAVPVADWMPRRADQTDVRPGVVHGDLHPDNVMLTADGPVLIDWTRSGIGDRRMDLAHTWLIVAELGLPDDSAGRTVHTVARRALLAAFLRGIDHDGAQSWLARIAAERMTDKNTTDDEHRRLARYLTKGTNVWPNARATRRVVAPDAHRPASGRR